MTTKKRVYCAGPLFTTKEREEMDQLASALEHAGYETFLPQRDGLELTECVRRLVRNGMEETQAGEVLSKAIFALDVYQVLHGCQALVANLNGRVPDEGTVSEAAMAWIGRKLVVGYKADSRTAFNGQDNPLVAGLFGFHLCKSPDEVVEAIERNLRNATFERDISDFRDQEMASLLSLGEAIWAQLTQHRDVAAVVEVISQAEARTALAGYERDECAAGAS